MLPLDNEFLTDLDDDIEECTDLNFKSYYCDQIVQAKNKLCEDVSKATGEKDYDDLRFVHLNKRNITKDKLCVWLETAICILNKYCDPALYAARDIIENLSTEKVANQQKVIELQEKLIDKRDEELSSLKTTLQTTVQSEMKSYSTALTSTCNKALAPRKLTAALKSATVEEDRGKNLVIYGVQEDEKENLHEKVLEVLHHVDEKPQIVSCYRLGRDKAKGGPDVKPIKLTLAGTDHVRQILRKTGRLKEVQGYSSVYISPDRSEASRKAYRRLVEELKQKRTAETDKRHFIRNFKVVSSEKG